jgi:hypothetical protein
MRQVVASVPGIEYDVADPSRRAAALPMLYLIEIGGGQFRQVLWGQGRGQEIRGQVV